MKTIAIKAQKCLCSDDFLKFMFLSFIRVTISDSDMLFNSDRIGYIKSISKLIFSYK